MERTGTNLARRLCAAALAAVAATCLAAPAALAATGGDGGTDLVVKVDAKEVSSDPDDSGTGYYAYGATGANLTFTIPTEVVYTVAADGTLTQQGGGVAVTNTSALPAYVSSLKVTPANGFTFASAVNSNSPANTVQLSIKATANSQVSKVNLAGWANKKNVTPNSTAWNMSSAGGTSPQVVLTSEDGKVSYLSSAPPAGGASFGTITWYLKPGARS